MSSRFIKTYFHFLVYLFFSLERSVGVPYKNNTTLLVDSCIEYR